MAAAHERAVSDCTRQYARLLVFRSRLQDRSAGEVKADGTGSFVAAA